jgi:hypothetical protein
MSAIRPLWGGKETDLKHAALSRVSSVHASHAVRGLLERPVRPVKWSDVVPRTNNRIASDNVYSWKQKSGADF